MGVTSRAGEERVYDFALEDFRGITWPVLVCMSERPDHDPNIHQLPPAVWRAYNWLIISSASSEEFDRHRWSPETRQEKQHQPWIDEALKDEGF